MNDFNISFKTPATDECSECLRLKSQIKVRKDQEKAKTMARCTIHKTKAKAFHDLLRNQIPNVFKFSFDCQKNLLAQSTRPNSLLFKTVISI